MTASFTQMYTRRVTTMMRVSAETRARVMRVAAEDFGGATADEAVARLLDEHWQAKCVAAVERYRATDPVGWAEYLREADEWDTVSAPISDSWDEPAA